MLSIPVQLTWPCYFQYFEACRKSKSYDIKYSLKYLISSILHKGWGFIKTCFFFRGLYNPFVPSGFSFEEHTVATYLLFICTLLLLVELLSLADTDLNNIFVLHKIMSGVNLKLAYFTCKVGIENSIAILYLISRTLIKVLGL